MTAFVGLDARMPAMRWVPQPAPIRRVQALARTPLARRCGLGPFFDPDTP